MNTQMSFTKLDRVLQICSSESLTRKALRWVTLFMCAPVHVTLAMSLPAFDHDLEAEYAKAYRHNQSLSGMCRNLCRRLRGSESPDELSLPPQSAEILANVGFGDLIYQNIKEICEGRQGTELCDKQCCTLDEESMRILGTFFGFRECCQKYFLKIQSRSRENKSWCGGNVEFNIKGEVLRYAIDSYTFEGADRMPYFCDTCCEEILRYIPPGEWFVRVSKSKRVRDDIVYAATKKFGEDFRAAVEAINSKEESLSLVDFGLPPRINNPQAINLKFLANAPDRLSFDEIRHLVDATMKHTLTTDEQKKRCEFIINAIDADRKWSDFLEAYKRLDLPSTSA